MSQSELAHTTPGELVVPAPNIFDTLDLKVPDDVELPAVGISKETCQFELPDGTYVKTLRGHLLWWHYANSYWQEAFGQSDNKFPTCLSPDGVKPIDMDMPGYALQAHGCEGCPQNVFGSGEEGVGKACQNTIRLYVLLDNEVIPVQIKATATSLGKKRPLTRWLFNVINDVAKAFGTTYAVSRLEQQRARYQYAHVELALDPDETKTGFKVAVLHPKTLDVVTDPEAVARLIRAFKSFSGAWLYERVAKAMTKEAAGEQVPAGEAVEGEWVDQGT